MTPNPNLDIAWVLIASALVLLMQAGFLCLEARHDGAKKPTFLYCVYISTTAKSSSDK